MSDQIHQFSHVFKSLAPNSEAHIGHAILVARRIRPPRGHCGCNVHHVHHGGFQWLGILLSQRKSHNRNMFQPRKKMKKGDSNHDLFKHCCTNDIKKCFFFVLTYLILLYRKHFLSCKQTCVCRDLLMGMPKNMIQSDL